MNKIPKNIDHLIYTTSHLEKGMREIKSLLGVTPIIGGKHPKYGTHNAQISLGESIYLEIIAPDPNLSEPENGILFEKDFQEGSKLKTWVLRSEKIEELYAKAIENDIKLGTIEAGKREKPDGTFVHWKLTDPYALPFDGAMPFLISWGNTPHPAHQLPKTVELIELIIEHPTPQLLQDKLQILNVNMNVQESENMKVRAKIKTKNGIVLLE